LTETIRKDKYLYEQGKRRESLQKYWKDKKKENSDQRKKGFKPPFNRNNPNKNQREQPAKDESKREDSLEKGEYLQSNVGDAKKITCTRISLTKNTK
jgi:protein involved in sex pheromone biosynthesis